MRDLIWKKLDKQRPAQGGVSCSRSQDADQEGNEESVEKKKTGPSRSQQYTNRQNVAEEVYEEAVATELPSYAESDDFVDVYDMIARISTSMTRM